MKTEFPIFFLASGSLCLLSPATPNPLIAAFESIETSAGGTKHGDLVFWASCKSYSVYPLAPSIGLPGLDATTIGQQLAHSLAPLHLVPLSGLDRRCYGSPARQDF